ncbi:MAG: alginate lyase family protein [bacterium]
MYPDIITPRSYPDKLEELSYDPFDLMPKAFPARPHVFTTPARLATTRKMAAAGGWPAKALDRLLDRAAGPITFPVQHSAKPDLMLAQDAALHALCNAYAGLLTRKPDYRRRAIEILRRLARAYPRWPVIPGQGRLGCEDISEGHFIEQIARTYDCLAAARLSAGDHRLFRTLLEATRPASDTARHTTCGNHGTGVMMGSMALAVALHDRQGIHDVLYGCRRNGQWCYGLIHQLRHDILSDGMHWERTPGYHFFTLYLLVEMADLLLPLGVDLWHAELPPQWQDDGHDLHRAYGPYGGVKTLKAAFDAPFYLAFPNGDFSTLGDSRLENMRGVFSWGMLYERAYEVYGDPKYAWFLSRAEAETPADQRRLPGLPLALQPTWINEVEFGRIARVRYPKGRFDLRTDARFALAGEHRGSCSYFPAYGATVLRSAPEIPEAPSAFLFWGPHSAGHQSPAALHVDISGGGEKATDAPRMDNRGYSDPMFLTWGRTTIAHNTVTVDQAPMFPYDFETQSIWEADRWRDTISDGEPLLFQPDGHGFKAARAMNERVYPGVLLDRTLVVTKAFVLDAFRVSSDRLRQFDWAMHVVGNPELPGSVRTGSLGNRRGYRHFLNPKRMPAANGAFQLSWKRVQGLTHASVILPQRCTAWTAMDPIPAPEKMHTLGELGLVAPRHTLILRTRDRSALFLSVWSFGQAPVALKLVSGRAVSDLVIRTGLGASATLWKLPADRSPVTCT